MVKLLEMFNIFNGPFLFIKETYGYSFFLWLNVLTVEISMDILQFL